MSQIFEFFSTSFTGIGILFVLQLIILLEIFISLFSLFAGKKTLPASIFHKASRFLIFTFGIQVLLLGMIFSDLIGISELNKIHPIIFPFLISLNCCLLIWFWCFPLNEQKTNFPLFLYVFSAIVIFILELIFTFLIRVSNYNIPLLLTILMLIVSTIFLLIGIILLLVYRPSKWFTGVIFSLILILGIINTILSLSLLKAPSLQFLLFCEVIAFILIPFLTQSLKHKTGSDEVKEANGELLISDMKKINLPAQRILKSWIDLAILDQAGQIAEKFIIAVGNTFDADQAILVGSSNANEEAFILSEYSMNQKEKEKRSLPPLQSFAFFRTWINEKRSIIFHKKDKFPRDVLSFLSSVGRNDLVNILFSPIRISDKSNHSFGILLISPRIHWDQTHLNYMEDMKGEFIQILNRVPICDEIEGGKQESSLLSRPGTTPRKKPAHLSSDPNESDQEKIRRLESELKLTLEEYDRVHKLLEENIRKSSSFRQ
jgi:hypothetical protein